MPSPASGGSVRSGERNAKSVGNGEIEKEKRNERNAVAVAARRSSAYKRAARNERHISLALWRGDNKCLFGAAICDDL